MNKIPTSKSRSFVPNRSESLAFGLSALLFAVAFPPFKLLIPVLVCLVPMSVYIARAADRGASVGTAWRTGLWFGFISYGLNLYWIAVALTLFTKLAIAGFVASLIWLAPFVAASFVALYYLRKSTRWPLAILLPLCWVALEFVLNYLSDLSFPWLPLGLGLAHFPVLTQLAEISGVRGVSFWIAAVNGLLADAWLLRAHASAAKKRIAGVFCVLAVVIAFGAWRLSTVKLEPLADVGVIQPNIPEHIKLNVDNPSEHVSLMVGMTRELLRAEAPDLVVWPEAALDRFLWQYPMWEDSLQTAVSERPTPLLVGMLDWETLDSGAFKYYNAAAMTSPYGWIISGTYRKHFLVPIVERVPFLNPEWFSRLDYFGGYSRGIDPSPFPYQFGGVGVMICYESIFPQLSRSYAKQGAVLLANITNDAWFQRSTAPSQHFAHMILRAVETRLPVVRAANTGISGYIDPLGRVRQATPIFEQRAEVYDIEKVAADTGPTVYVRAGDFLGPLSLLSTLILLLVPAFGRLKNRPRGTTAL